MNTRTAWRRGAPLLAAVLLAACHKKPAELAPVSGGESFDYKFTIGSGQSESAYYASIKIVADGKDSFKIVGEPQGENPPVNVDGALDSGHPIKVHWIGQLWLPPSQRVMGTKVRVGDVKGESRFKSRPAWKVVGNGGAEYLFDKDTGFLLTYRIAVGGGVQSAQLLKSSVGVNP